METAKLGPWQVLLTLNRLRHDDGTETVLEPKVMKVLSILLQHSGEVVTRDRLLNAAWPGEYVTEHVLSRSISELRKALGDDHRAPRYIETIRKVGFRLIPPPSTLPASSGPSASPAPSEEAPRQQADPPPIGPARPVPFSSRVAILGSAAVLAVLAIAGIWTWPTELSRPGEPPVGDTQPRPLTSFPGPELDPALSPDGGRLAFSWSGAGHDNFDIYVKALGEEQPLRLTHHSAEDKNPAWSPDGHHIAFVRASKGINGVFVVPLLGGEERKLADCVSGDIPDLVWSRDGRFLFFPDRQSLGEASGIFQLDLSTRKKRRLTRPPAHVSGDRDLTVSPDGRHIAFARAVSPGVEDLFVVATAGGSPRRLSFDSQPISGLEWLGESGEILFSSHRGGTGRLWSVAVEGRSEPRLHRASGDHAYDPTFSPATGRLAFERRIYDFNIWFAPLNPGSDPLSGSVPEAGEPRGVIASTRTDSFPVLSPDGSRLAFVSGRSGSDELWVSELDGSGSLRLTDFAATAVETLLVREPAWSPDGETLIFMLQDPRQSDLYRVSAQSGPPEQLTASSWNEVAPALSADGRQLYFGSDQTGEWQIWSQRLPTGEALQLTRNGGVKALEAADGQHLYISRVDRTGIWRVPVGGGPEIAVLVPEGSSRWVDWTLAGQALYYRTIEPNPTVPSSIFRFDLETQQISLVLDTISGQSLPGLGLTVSGDEKVLLFGKIDRGDGDIMLIEEAPAG
ncbi:MAG: LpqB family beta-propeller domain-containing protein [Thermoanaerobaculia bacterium]|nr:LpqB family beta-propeller domain-containing protein [Thermoanaerobaculia bacterium]